MEIIEHIISSGDTLTANLIKGRYILKLYNNLKDIKTSRKFVFEAVLYFDFQGKLTLGQKFTFFQ